MRISGKDASCHLAVTVCAALLAFLPEMGAASYGCSVERPHAVPAIEGKRYVQARQALIQTGWEPAARSLGRWPEEDGCTPPPGRRCEFIFQDHSLYQLVVVTHLAARHGPPLVERHYFRCRTEGRSGNNAHI